MEFDTSFWVQIIIYAGSFGTVFGSLTQRLKALEEKVDKHNNVVERMAVAERDLKSLWKYQDELKEEIRR